MNHPKKNQTNKIKMQISVCVLWMYLCKFCFSLLIFVCGNRQEQLRKRHWKKRCQIKSKGNCILLRHIESHLKTLTIFKRTLASCAIQHAVHFRCEKHAIENIVFDCHSIDIRLGFFVVVVVVARVIGEFCNSNWTQLISIGYFWLVSIPNVYVFYL